MKLTTLLFGLLLAVGWTSNVFAQSATYKAEDIKDWTYTWEDAGGTTQTSKYIDEVTDPYQMYGLLRWIYMDKRFPGPTYSAYDKNGNRERKVYYGGMDGGWEIPGTVIPTPPVTTTTITEYVKVTSTAGLESGAEYLIVCEQNSVALNGSLTDFYNTTTGFINTISVSPSGGIIESNATTDAATFTITSSGNSYTIRSKSGYYIGNASATNTQIMESTNTQYSNSISFSNGDASILYTHSANWRTYNYYLKYGYATNMQRFAYTTSTSNYRNIQLYKKQTRTITTGGVQAIGDISITGNNSYGCMTSITVKSGGTTIFSWSHANDAYTFPLGMHHSGYSYGTGSIGWISVQSDLAPFRLDGWLFTNYDNVQVIIEAFNKQSTDPASITVNGEERLITTPYSTSQGSTETLTWNISSKPFNAPVEYEADTYTPNEEGYTALVVKLKNNLTLEEDDDEFDASLYNTKEEIIQYFSKNVRSIQLLTDGLRINEGDNPGTIFNCPGESDYNRFFFLGKGQARQKADVVRTMQIYKEHLLGESVPFRQMFEQFSPTGGHKGDDVKDFYSKMMKGQIFPVVHDCLSVIQNQHEFSMSGHDGTTAYAMPGMNFFIPDYRLKYWEDDFHYVTYSVSTSGDTTYTDHGYFHVDGRIMNPHQTVSADGDVTFNRSLQFKSPQNLAVWYAQYDTAHHAPVTGIYLLHLQAEANKVDGYSEPNNRYYNVDLDWRSSLNEMSGVGVKQTYIIYQVVTDPETGVRTRVPIDTVKDCSDFRPHLRLDTLYEQQAHSYTLTYIIEGSPTDSDHPEFIAWSNEVKVIIPGYDDFMILKLHHYESDFEIRRVGDTDYNAENGTYDEKNYYRNYLQPENDIVNGISAQSILGGYDSFMLYRSYTVDGVQVNEAVAKLKFAVDQQGKVLYKITYIDEHENYHAPNFDNTELINIINQLLNNQ